MIDDPAYQRAIDLSACLCLEIAAADLPEPCYCGVFFGGDVPFDFCNSCDDGRCGQAWVRLIDAYPSNAFPNPDGAATCATVLAYRWEVGIARCAPTVDEFGAPPSLDANLDATRLQYADMRAMRRAIQCCFGAGDVDYVLSTYTPFVTLGGCGGGAWEVVSR